MMEWRYVCLGSRYLLCLGPLPGLVALCVWCQEDDCCAGDEGLEHGVGDREGSGCEEHGVLASFGPRVHCELVSSATRQ